MWPLDTGYEDLDPVSATGTGFAEGSQAWLPLTLGSG